MLEQAPDSASVRITEATESETESHDSSHGESGLEWALGPNATFLEIAEALSGGGAPQPRLERKDVALGIALVAVRRTLGMSQSDLASEFGVDRLTIVRWEMGYTRPREESLLRFQDVACLALETSAGRRDAEIRRHGKVADALGAYLGFAQANNP